jgi:hypothetical protein
MMEEQKITIKTASDDAMNFDTPNIVDQAPEERHLEAARASIRRPQDVIYRSPEEEKASQHLQ